MTDAEIITALSCCQTGCVGCPLIGNIKCRQILSQQAIALIERQQERFDSIMEQLEKNSFRVGCSFAPSETMTKLIETDKAIEIVKGGAE